MQNRLEKNTIYSFIKSFSQVVFPLITFPYISRVLQAENVGKINFSTSIISYIGLVASLGISTYAIRECSKVKSSREELNKVTSEIFSINIITTLVAYIILILALIFFRSLQAYKELIIILSVSVLFTTLGADWLNTAMEDFKYITIRTFVFQMFSLISMLMFVKSSNDYLKYAVITVISTSGANICNLIYRKKYCSTMFTLKINWKRHFRPILLLFALIMSQTIFVNSDITILGVIKGNFEVGLYSTSVKIYSLVNTTISSIAWVVMPKMSYLFQIGNYKEINKLYKYAFNFIVVIGLPCIVGINALCHEIIEIVGGKEYLGAVLSLRILSISLGLSLIGGLIGNIIMLPSGKESIFLKASIISAFFNLISNILFIPIFGLNAAATTTVFSQLIMVIILYLNIDKNIKIQNIHKLLLSPVIGSVYISLICIVIHLLISNLLKKVIISILLSMSGYLVILVLLKNKFILGFVRH
ncbi:flippase [Candidatus Stoquefichus massiliensis]|uniref:flippase n=1 Tax=Candidatus Stoquefichus massiliensis TaxID=1470350 RepID=UPI000485A4D5|nr:flippase [Candidatus Stoquefichus massiliensis]